MAAPTAPTLVSLSTEGLKQAGYSSPSASQLARAQDEYFASIKNDIFQLAKKPKFLQTTSIIVLTEGKNRYANPSDYSSDMEMDLLQGVNVGTATAGSTSSVTLATTDTFNQSDIIGKDILVTANTGVGSMSQITAYDDTTKIASVTPDFTTAPANLSTYMLIDTYEYIEQVPSFEFTSIARLETLLGRPRLFMPAGSSTVGEFTLFPTPWTDDETLYGIRFKYYANIMTLDLAGTLMATLYSRFRNIWVSGVKAKQLEDDDDNRQFQAKQEYNQFLQAMIMREQYGMDLNNLSLIVPDYT
jgi:hypothetical protein